MRTKNRVGIEIEGIVHCPCGMVARNVERLEVVIVVLNFRPLGNAIANATKNLFHSLQSPRDWMQSPACLSAPRQCHIDSLG
jgi:hypothetical protein